MTKSVLLVSTDTTSRTAPDNAKSLYSSTGGTVSGRARWGEHPPNESNAPTKRINQKPALHLGCSMSSSCIRDAEKHSAVQRRGIDSSQIPVSGVTPAAAAP